MTCQKEQDTGIKMPILKRRLKSSFASPKIGLKPSTVLLEESKSLLHLNLNGKKRRFLPL